MTDIMIKVVWEGDRGGYMPSTLSWSPSDPLAVRLVFEAANGEIEWFFARDLIRDALTSGTAGTGDVQAIASDGKIVLVLESPSGEAALMSDSLPIGQFIGRTYDTVPAGFEYQGIEMDALVAFLLEGEDGK
jgi:hypothetical protein